MKNPTRFKSKHAAALIALAASPLATGQTLVNFSWYGDGVTPNWTVNDNWGYDNESDLPYPSKAGDSATINTGEVILDSISVTLETLSIGDASLTLNGGNTHAVRQLRIGNGGTGSLFLNGGTLKLINQTLDDLPPTNQPAPLFSLGTPGGNGTLTQTAGSLSLVATSIDKHNSTDPANWTYDGHPDTRIGEFGGSGTYNLQGGTADIYNLRVGFANGSSVGTINHSAGTLTHYGELALGWAGAKGIYNLSGSGNLVQANNRIRVGATGGPGTEGTFNQTGGTAEITNGRLELGTESGGKGTYNMSAGTMLVHDDIFVGAFDDTVPQGTTGIYNQTGGTVTANRVLVAFGTGTFGTVNLNGGTLRANSIFLRADIENGSPVGGTGTLNFDGGTVVATGGGNYIYNFPNVNVKAGGATFDTNEQYITIVPPIVGVGGVTKKGLGVLNITAQTDYSGDTVVEQGYYRLTVPGGLDPASSVKIQTTTGGLLELAYTGSDTVSQLIVDGVSQPAGTYGAGPTDGSFTEVGYIIGTGKLIVTGTVTPPAGYSAWASDPANGLAEGQRGASVDADNDGFSNLLEYFLGGNPSQASTTIAPVLTTSGGDIQLSFNRSALSSGDTTGVVQWSSDLATWSPGTAISGSGTINMTVPGSNAVNGKLFARIKVSQPAD